MNEIIENEFLTATLYGYNDQLRQLKLFSFVSRLLISYSTTFARMDTYSYVRLFDIFSHEMQHYLSAIQNYISNQVINLSWEEFQKRLDAVKTIDELLQAHMDYLRSAMTR